MQNEQKPLYCRKLAYAKRDRIAAKSKNIKGQQGTERATLIATAVYFGHLSNPKGTDKTRSTERDLLRSVGENWR